MCSSCGSNNVLLEIKSNVLIFYGDPGIFPQRFLPFHRKELTGKQHMPLTQTSPLNSRPGEPPAPWTSPVTYTLNSLNSSCTASEKRKSPPSRPTQICFPFNTQHLRGWQLLICQALQLPLQLPSSMTFPFNPHISSQTLLTQSFKPLLSSPSSLSLQ